MKKGIIGVCCGFLMIGALPAWAAGEEGGDGQRLGESHIAAEHHHRRGEHREGQGREQKGDQAQERLDQQGERTHDRMAKRANHPADER